MEKMYVVHYPRYCHWDVEICETLEEAKSVIEREERNRGSHLRFIETVLDEDKAVKYIESCIADKLANELSFVPAYNYILLFNEMIVSYIEQRKPGWTALRKKYDSLFVIDNIINEEYDFCDWYLYLTREGTHVHFGGNTGWDEVREVPEKGFNYTSLHKNIITAYNAAMEDASRRDDKQYANLIRSHLTYITTEYLRKLQNWPEVVVADYGEEDLNLEPDLSEYDYVEEELELDDWFASDYNID